MTEARITVDVDGTLRFIYSDDVQPLLALGDATVERASHVEPAIERPGWWTADMSPVDGPVLGPFATRAEALAEEVEWLRAHRNL